MKTSDNVRINFPSLGKMEMFIVPDGMTVTQEQTKWLLVRLETFNFFSGKL